MKKYLIIFVIFGCVSISHGNDKYPTHPVTQLTKVSSGQYVSTDYLQTTLLAAPGADGFGKFTTGGRGGQIIHVTNLNNSGVGSLRAAINTDGVRTIVFDVGGDIFLTEFLTIRGLEGNLTIAGETAPFPGITVRGDNITSSSFGGVFDISASNIMIRYLTIRVNNNGVADLDAMRLRNDNGMSDIFIDHVTFSNGDDENFSMQGVTNSTLSNSILASSDNNYNYLFARYNSNHTAYANLFTHTSYRNPLIGYGLDTDTSEWINNIIFGYDTGGFSIVYGNIVDVLGNVFKAWNNNEPNTYSINWEPNSFNNPNAVITDGGFYAVDNFQVNPEAHQYGILSSTDANVMKSNRQITNSLISNWANTISTIEELVLPKVGNSIHRDAMDAAAISDYINGSNQRTLTILSKTPTTRPASDDSDNDDLLDAAEIAIWGNITTTNSPWSYTNGTNISGYDSWTNHEKTRFYLAGDLATTPPPVTPPTLGSGNSVTNARRRAQ